jgi:hypothetical protein
MLCPQCAGVVNKDAAAKMFARYFGGNKDKYAAERLRTKKAGKFDRKAGRTRKGCGVSL